MAAEAKTGRPSTFTAELAESICIQLGEGMSLRSICRADDMPDRETVMRWVRANEIFRGQYAQARQAQAETLADELLDIADDGTNDYVDRVRQDGAVDRVLDAEHVMRSRLRVDTRKWFLSKVLPKVYGEKLEVEQSGVLTIADDTDRPPRETREQWIARRAKELGVDPRLLGTPAGAAD